MRGLFCAAICVGFLLAVSVQISNAFGLSGAGVQGGVVDRENLDGTVSIGGHLELEQLAARVLLVSWE